VVDAVGLWGSAVVLVVHSVGLVSSVVGLMAKLARLWGWLWLLWVRQFEWDSPYIGVDVSLTMEDDCVLVPDFNFVPLKDCFAAMVAK
jgi:hypothetical protein